MGKSGAEIRDRCLAHLAGKIRSVSELYDHGFTPGRTKLIVLADYGFFRDGDVVVLWPVWSSCYDFTRELPVSRDRKSALGVPYALLARAPDRSDSDTPVQ